MSRIINVSLLCVSDLKGALTSNHFTDITFTVPACVFMCMYSMQCRDKIDHNVGEKMVNSNIIYRRTRPKWNSTRLIPISHHRRISRTNSGNKHGYGNGR